MPLSRRRTVRDAHTLSLLLTVDLVLFLLLGSSWPVGSSR